MSKIKIIAVGKLKHQFLKQAQDFYLSRLKPYGKIEIIELKEEKVTPSVNLTKALAKESKQIISKMTDGFFISLSPTGKQMDSIKFAEFLQPKLSLSSEPLTFIIGGSNGLTKEVINKSNYNLSFSLLTFPHTLFRIILLEQIYRSFTIINNKIYHK